MIEQVELAIIIEEILFSTQRVKLRLNATEIAYECFKYFFFFFLLMVNNSINFNEPSNDLPNLKSLNTNKTPTYADGNPCHG